MSWGTYSTLVVEKRLKKNHGKVREEQKSTETKVILGSPSSRLLHCFCTRREIMASDPITYRLLNSCFYFTVWICHPINWLQNANSSCCDVVTFRQVNITFKSHRNTKTKRRKVVSRCNITNLITIKPTTVMKVFELNLIFHSDCLTMNLCLDGNHKKTRLCYNMVCI